MSIALSITDLSASFGPNAALAGVDMAVPAGASVAVIGPNGSGKSTLLKLIAGVMRPSKGTLDTFAKPVAIVLQSTEVDPALPLTARDTVSMARYYDLGFFRPFGRSDHDFIDQILERLELSAIADQQLHQLSGGQRQRVFVAQGLAQAAPILLLDEPLIGLDVTSRKLITSAIEQEHALGRTIITTTHDFSDAGRCDLVLLLATRCIAFGTPEEVLTETNLQKAFGGRFVKVDGTLVLDDPHHEH